MIQAMNLKHQRMLQQYISDIHPISTSHFIYRTLIPHYDLLKTQTAKQIAQKNKKILLKFIDKQKRLCQHKNHI